jgi:hypothetical protein
MKLNKGQIFHTKLGKIVFLEKKYISISNTKDLKERFFVEFENKKDHPNIEIIDEREFRKLIKSNI